MQIWTAEAANVAATCRAAGFTLEGTGGGCTAWIRQAPSGVYVMTTDEPEHVTQFVGFVAVGVHPTIDEIGDPVTDWHEFESLAEALRWVSDRETREAARGGAV